MFNKRGQGCTCFEKLRVLVLTISYLLSRPTYFHKCSFRYIEPTPRFEFGAYQSRNLDPGKTPAVDVAAARLDPFPLFERRERRRSHGCHRVIGTPKLVVQFLMVQSDERREKEMREVQPVVRSGVQAREPQY